MYQKLRIHAALQILSLLVAIRRFSRLTVIDTPGLNESTQYTATIEYYAKLLPALFEKNVFIVMTNYETGERAELLKKKQGINEEHANTRECSKNSC